MFETIGVWDKIADEAQPILDMVVTDSRLQDAVRPVLLSFDGDVEPGEPFADMVENGPLLDRAQSKKASRRVSTCVRPQSKISLLHLPLKREGSRQRLPHEVIVDLADGTKFGGRACWWAPMVRVQKPASTPAFLTRGWDYRQSSNCHHRDA